MLYLISIAIVFILLIINELLGLGLNLENENFLNIFVIIVGLICVIVTYNLLKKKWEKEAIIKEDEISDIGISTKE